MPAGPAPRLAPAQGEARDIDLSNVTNLAVALGVGLLIGAERERRKREKGSPATAGIRTFAVAAITGAVSFLLGGVLLLAAGTLAVSAFAAAAVWQVRQRDPGITTEVALVLTVLVGALAMREPALAAGIGVVAAILLAARTPLHNFVGATLSEDEVRDALIFAGATLVVLPLLPDRAMGPFAALNPHSVWLIVVLILGISGAGHMAVRLFGARFGLPLAGLSSGFVSSVATIGAMGARAAKSPAVMSAAVAGAVLSTVATIVQMAVVVAAVSLPTLRAMAAPLLCAGLAAVAYGIAFTVRALRQPIEADPAKGQAFSLTSAVTFAATLAVILVASAAARAWFGAAGSVAAAALAGLVDTHAAAISIAAQVAAGRMSPADAALPILTALSTNTVTKLVFAWTSGGRAFALRVIPGLVLVIVSAWAGAAATNFFS